MKSKTDIMNSPKLVLIVSVSVGLFALAAPAAEPKQDAAAAAPSNQKQFDSPRQAADSLLQAAASFDVPALKEILGPDSDDIIISGDPVADKNQAATFAARGKEKTSVDMDKTDPNYAILTVGNDDFPVPIPLVKNKGKWSFDTKVGREEILNRRIGVNELNAIRLRSASTRPNMSMRRKGMTARRCANSRKKLSAVPENTTDLRGRMRMAPGEVQWEKK